MIEPRIDLASARSDSPVMVTSGGLAEQLQVAACRLGQAQQAVDQGAALRPSLQLRQGREQLGVRRVVGEGARERGLGGVRIAPVVTVPGPDPRLQVTRDRGRKVLCRRDLALERVCQIVPGVRRVRGLLRGRQGLTRSDAEAARQPDERGRDRAPPRQASCDGEGRQGTREVGRRLRARLLVDTKRPLGVGQVLVHDRAEAMAEPRTPDRVAQRGGSLARARGGPEHVLVGLRELLPPPCRRREPRELLGHVGALGREDESAGLKLERPHRVVAPLFGDLGALAEDPRSLGVAVGCVVAERGERERLLPLVGLGQGREEGL